MKKLTLIRHAKSDWDAGAPSDFDRPLSKRGRKAASAMGRFIRREAGRYDHVLVSPARRRRNPDSGIVKYSAATWRRHIGAGQEVNSDTLLKMVIGPDAFNHDNTLLKAVKGLGVNDDITPLIADADPVAFCQI